MIIAGIPVVLRWLREQCAVRDPSRDGTRGPGHVLNGDNTDENKQPNLGKDVASATDKDKAELGGAGAGIPARPDQAQDLLGRAGCAARGRQV